jgi:hypothetical protein
LDLASDRLFRTENLVILLNLELFHDVIQVRHHNFPILLPYRDNKVVLTQGEILDKRALLIQVRVDYQVEGKARNLMDDVVLVAVLDFEKTLVSLEQGLVGAHIEEAHDASFFNDHHNRVDGRKGDVDYAML